MTFQDYQLAAGHDNAGGLTNVETTIPASQQQTFLPQGRGNFDEGVLRVRGDGLTYLTGFQAFSWPLDVLPYAQWDFMRTTYTTGGNSFSGKVTVRTRLIDGTYANFNALLHLPEPPDETKKFVALRDTEILFTRAVAI